MGNIRSPRIDKYKHKHNINKNLYKSILFTLELNSII